jgi:hypothetical protein
MTAAFKEAKMSVKRFIAQTPDCPAPIIINISDGVPYIGGNLDYDEAKKSAQGIMNLTCEDGNPLIFNVHIEKNSFNVKFPASKKEIPQDENACFLFDISSEIPISMAKESGLKIKENARGCIIGTDADNFIKFIGFGSSKPLWRNKVKQTKI